MSQDELRAANMIIQILSHFTEEERVSICSEVNDTYCHSCGIEKGGYCHCTNDE